MLQIPNFEISPYLNLCFRRRWFIIIPFVLCVCAGMVYLTVCPKTYKASSLVLLEPQTIPDSFVKSTLTETMEGRLTTISQQISSRTNIERIVKDFHLSGYKPDSKLDKILENAEERFPFIRNLMLPGSQNQQTNEQASLHDVIERVRKNLQVHVRTAGREQNMSFEVSFIWSDQSVVAPVTNALVARFIEDNLNARQEVASNTTDFLDTEASSIRSELEAREKELETFRTQNMGTLPDQQQSNINILAQLREQARALEARIEQERQQAMFLKSQEEITRAEKSVSALAAPGPSQGSPHGSTADSQMSFAKLTNGTLEDLEAELTRLRLIYTENHPAIIVLKRQIEEMKKHGDNSSARKDDVSSGSSRTRVDLQLAQINADIESYKKQIQEVHEQIEVYKQRVERAPEIEVELNKVLRGYETVRQRYDNLLSRKLDAKMAEELERRKKGAQFRVLDPAVKPGKSFGPDPLKSMMMAVVAGLGLGFGLAFLRETLDPAFHSPEDAQAYLKTEVIVSLPVVRRNRA
jgi:polysaccharide chain length determinant protein (PEP-CTERM system associated)